MSQLSGSKEAFRLYTLALSYEALAYRDPEHPKEAAELLNKSTKYYDDARKIDGREREFLLAQIRVQDSLDHYLDIQRYIQNRPAVTATTAESTIPPQTTGSSIQAAIETTMPPDPRTFRYWPVARCSTRRTQTLQPKYGCHR